MVTSTVRKKLASRIPEGSDNGLAEDVAVFCPRCKAFQTISMDGNNMIPTRKFFQEGGQIYHDCGSDRPCRLYRIY